MRYSFRRCGGITSNRSNPSICWSTTGGLRGAAIQWPVIRDSTLCCMRSSICAGCQRPRGRRGERCSSISFAEAMSRSPDTSRPSGTEFLDRSPTAMSRSGARFSQAGCSVRKVEPLSHFIPDEAHRMSPAPHALVLRAREALARGDVRSAEAAVDERLKTAGRDINALGVRSFLLQRRGQFGEAARTLQTVIGIDARADWAYHELIQILLAHRRLADAEQVARA